MTNFRIDGNDSPLSPNSGRMTWSQVERICDESDAVDSYRDVECGLEITWCDGNVEMFVNPVTASAAIEMMSHC